MKIRKSIAVINRMKADGVIARYAIGGAVGATFYLEPSATLDLDVFVSFNPTPSSRLISLEPIYTYLIARGCKAQGEYIEIAGWPVQFLPPTGALVEEALEEAITTDVDGEPVFIFSAEHLAAIALQTGRPKDMARILQFIEANVLDYTRLDVILVRNNLKELWSKFEQRFLRGLNKDD